MGSPQFIENLSALLKVLIWLGLIIVFAIFSRGAVEVDRRLGYRTWYPFFAMVSLIGLAANQTFFWLYFDSSNWIKILGSIICLTTSISVSVVILIFGTNGGMRGVPGSP